ncbi:nuclear body protein SP140-like protein [Hipposideros larvatus]
MEESCSAVTHVRDPFMRTVTSHVWKLRGARGVAPSAGEASSGSRECHRGSEVLQRQMGPEEQLKCEFLLLKAYRHLEVSIFRKIPRDNYEKETSQCMKELMLMFSEIKKKLKKRVELPQTISAKTRSKMEFTPNAM